MENNTQITAIQEDYSGELEAIDTDQPSPVVETDEAVITILSRLNVRDKMMATVTSHANFMREQADEWEKRAIEKIEKQKEWLRIPLQSFIESINKSNPKIKSLKFPTGTIGLRQSPQKIEIDEDFDPSKHTDDPNVVAKTTWSVCKSVIAKTLKETGEIPDYASVVPGETKFYYRPNEKAGE